MEMLGFKRILMAKLVNFLLQLKRPGCRDSVLIHPYRNCFGIPSANGQCEK